MVHDVAPDGPSVDATLAPSLSGRGFSHVPSEHRAAQLQLWGAATSGLRDAYAKAYEAGNVNLASLAKKLGISPAALRAKLMGETELLLGRDWRNRLGARISRRAEFLPHGPAW